MVLFDRDGRGLGISRRAGGPRSSSGHAFGEGRSPRVTSGESIAFKFIFDKQSLGSGRGTILERAHGWGRFRN